MLQTIKKDYVIKKTKPIEEGKIYQCEIKGCFKKFKTPEFVHKHIFNKHADYLDDKFNQQKLEVLFKKNYFSDPRKMIS